MPPNLSFMKKNIYILLSKQPIMHAQLFTSKIIWWIFLSLYIYIMHICFAESKVMLGQCVVCVVVKTLVHRYLLSVVKSLYFESGTLICLVITAKIELITLYGMYIIAHYHRPDLVFSFSFISIFLSKKKKVKYIQSTYPHNLLNYLLFR